MQEVTNIRYLIKSCSLLLKITFNCTQLSSMVCLG